MWETLLHFNALKGDPANENTLLHRQGIDWATAEPKNDEAALTLDKGETMGTEAELEPR